MEALDSTELEKNHQRYVVSGGVSTQQGERPYQEDRAVLLLTTQCSHESYKKVSLAAVYDGHGGSAVAEILKEELHGKILSHLSPNKEEETFVTVFRQMDDSLFERPKVGLAGSCAIFSVLLDGVLFTAGLGDCEGVLVKVKGNLMSECIPLNTVHKGTTESERKRIEDLGGKVFFGRVFGNLAVARAFGDFKYKKQLQKEDFISSKPSVTRLELDPSCLFVILASDGLWDVCNHEKAGQLVTEWILKDKVDAQAAANRLIVHAQSNPNCTDNITVIVLQIHWNGVIPSFGSDPVVGIPLEQANEHHRSPIYETPLLQAPQPSPCGEGDLWLKTVKGKTLTRSYIHLDEGQKDYCKIKLGLDLRFPCWVSQEYISKKLFGEDGVKHLKDVEAHHGKFILWANVFSNTHTNFKYTEKNLIVDGEFYHGPEQYFQQQKSVGTPDETAVKEKMKQVTDPDKAFTIGRIFKMRSDWEDVKEDVMMKIVHQKYLQQEDLRELLLQTEGHLLVQMKPTDPFWGTGSDGKGENKMGVVTMNVRSSLLQK